MEKPNDEILSLLGFESEEIQAEHVGYIRAKYEDGISLDDIAQEYNVGAETLRQWMKLYDLEQYRQSKEKAAEARLAKLLGNYGRIRSLNAKKVLNRLESAELMEIKDHCQIEKTFGDRYALLRGDPTEHQKHTMEIVLFNKNKKQEENVDTK
jgi:transposase-like protein